MIRIRRRLRSCLFAMLLILPLITIASSLGSVTHVFAGPVQETWRRAWRNIGSACAKCDSPSSSKVQYAVVTVYESPNGQGKIQGYFDAGSYRADRGQMNRVGNDAISAIRVEAGYSARLCQNEGSGDGSGPCQEFARGQYNLSGEMNDETSFIKVWKD